MGRTVAVGLGAATAILIGYVIITPPPSDEGTETNLQQGPGRKLTAGNFTAHWDPIPETIHDQSSSSDGTSNIHPEDYVGPDACRECHKEQYALWSEHPHRWMNALANESTVQGDFSGTSIAYHGGHAEFFRENDRYLMRLRRDGTERVYNVNQTIGSRFFQYYVGTGIKGPEPAGHDFYTKDHVLPFGRWLDQEKWVPVVHVEDEMPDGKRIDPFHPPRPPDGGASEVEYVYAESCNFCHTTFPLADMFVRKPAVGTYAPRTMHFSTSEYIAETHPSVWDGSQHPLEVDTPTVMEAMWKVFAFEAPEKAVTLGISCEACHLGSKEHAAQELERPEFFPRSPHLVVEGNADQIERGRARENINWACGRCHTGGRPQFAAGMSTWNSVEFDDAMRGACYSELTCIHCHNPHERIGKKWSLSPAEDDALCLQCHQEYEPADARIAHTNHPLGNEGSRCMNCHMPRINEGLQDVVRTHMIFSPTRDDMIEANHPNACNLCHLEKPIDWTTKYLGEWYDAEFSEAAIATNYPQRDQPVGQG